MDDIRKHVHTDNGLGRDVVYIVGQTVCGGKVKINRMLGKTDRYGRQITYVYVENRQGENCLWKKIVATQNNVIELEYDWVKIIGDEWENNNDVRSTGSRSRIVRR